MSMSKPFPEEEGKGRGGGVFFFSVPTFACK